MNSFQRRITVVIGIPSLSGKVPWQWVLSRQNLGMPLVTTFVDKWVIGKPIDEARNEIVQFALDIGADYIFFLSDDVLVPVNTFLRLWSHQKDLISGVYWSKSNPPVPLIFRGFFQSPYLDWHVGELIKADAAGVDCLLARTKVFKKIPYPWFSIKYTITTPDEFKARANPDGRNFEDIGTTEDIYFYRKAKDYGFQLWIDTGIQCGHIDQFGNIYGMPIGAPQSIPGSEIKRKSKKLIADIGSGHQSWYLDGDVVTFDIREEVKPHVRCDIRMIPEPDQKYDMVFASHVLEHFTKEEAPKVLLEWLRILKVGGEIKVIVPNLEFAAKNILDGKIQDLDYWVLYGQQTYEENYHKHGYTPKTLERLFQSLLCLDDIKVKTDENNFNIIATAIKKKHIGIEIVNPDYDFEGKPLKKEPEIKPEEKPEVQSETNLKSKVKRKSQKPKQKLTQKT